MDLQICPLWLTISHVTTDVFSQAHSLPWINDV
ncbi:mCG1027294, partial [Mus musculus]